VKLLVSSYYKSSNINGFSFAEHRHNLGKGVIYMQDNINVENIILKNTIIKTRHSNYFDWVTTNVISTYRNYIEINQLDDYLVRV